MPSNRCIALTLILVSFLNTSVALSRTSPSLPGSQRPKAGGPQISITELISLTVFYRKLEKSRQEASWEKTASLWQEFELLFSTFAGDRFENIYSYDDFREAFANEIKIVIPFDKSIPEKDKFVYKMGLLGYSAKEISDVISGRITVSALDKAIKMRQLGYSQQEVSNYLDRNYKKIPADLKRGSLWERRPSGTGGQSILGPPHLDELAVRFSERHGLTPWIIRAIIKTESNWDPRAVSKKGAVGLMQLMPGTAQLLKVDPRDPEQNVEGGVRYFSFLYDTFKDLDLALIAYNAGPGYAERYAQGRVSLYGETRQYVRLVNMYYTNQKE
jgi:hypothetical protein